MLLYYRADKEGSLSELQKERGKRGRGGEEDVDEKL